MGWLARLLGNETPAAHAVDQAAASLQTRQSRVKPMNDMFIASATYRGVKALYLLDSDGKIVTELARPAEGERFGHFEVSPDALWVAYTRYVRRRPDRDAVPTICVVPAAGGDSNELKAWDPRYEPFYQNPVFSPTGQTIVCETGLQDASNPDLKLLELTRIIREGADFGHSAW